MILDTDDHATYMVAANDQYRILHKSESILLPYEKMFLLTKPAKMFVCCRFSNGNHNYSYTFEVDNDVDDGTKDNEDDQGVNLSMVKMARTILF